MSGYLLDLPMLTHLLVLVLIPLPAHQHPVPHEAEGVPRSVQPDVGFDIANNQDCHRHERQEPEEGAMEDDLSLRPDAVETMRKINPLTIANQVSQMFHNKRNQKITIPNRPAARHVKSLLTDDSLESLNVATQEDNEEVLPPAYIKQGVPKIVNKPRSNDFGYSVIVVAGDPVNLPLEVRGRDEGLEQQGIRSNIRKSEVRNKVNNQAMMGVLRDVNKEVRIPKPVNVVPNFPVYDEDFNFLPDPFHGILDENYWSQLDQASPLDMPTVLQYEPHRVRVRSDDIANIFNDKVPCGSVLGRKNSTDHGVTM